MVWNDNHEVRTQPFSPLKSVSIIKESHQFQNMVLLVLIVQKQNLCFDIDTVLFNDCYILRDRGTD